jgi:hypothetical protein
MELAVDEQLADYCEKSYGPAAKEMLTFIGFCEQNWPRLSPANPDSETLRQMQRLLDTAHTVAGDSVYTQRIELVAEYARSLLP